MKSHEDKSRPKWGIAATISPLAAILLASLSPNPVERWFSNQEPALAASTVAAAIGILLLVVLLLPIGLRKRASSKKLDNAT